MISDHKNGTMKILEENVCEFFPLLGYRRLLNKTWAPEEEGTRRHLATEGFEIFNPLVWKNTLKTELKVSNRGKALVPATTDVDKELFRN